MSHMNKVQAVVYQGHTLGLLGQSFNKPSIEILSTKSKAFGSTPHSMILHSVDRNDYREATLEDFKHFRVCHSDSYLISDS
mgnify:CR=1 FL=1|jgi:hypothetical protein